MPIIHIDGPPKSGKTALANSLRNTQIGKSRPGEGFITGALLIDDTQDGEPRYLLEKIILGASLGLIPGDGPPIPRPAASVPWKGWQAPPIPDDADGETTFAREDPLVIFVGDKIKLLKEFEQIVPGFTELFGPVRKMKIA